MEFEEIKKLIKLVKKSKISEFKYEDESAKFTIRTRGFSGKSEVFMQPTAMQPVAMQQVATPVSNQVATPVAAEKTEKEKPVKTATPEKTAESSNDSAKAYLEIKSPMVGTFYRSPSPEKPVFVKVGDTINVNDTICLIEAMKLFNDVKAEISGRIVKIMLEDASPVEYGQVLFLVEAI